MESHSPQPLEEDAWKADMLKLRGLEMLLVLFQIEDLRLLILSSTKPTNKRDKRLREGPTTPQQKLEVGRGILVSQGVISQSESDELPSLLDYRNVVGDGLPQHVERGAFSTLITFTPGESQRHNNEIAERVKAIREKVTKGMILCTLPPTSLEIQRSNAMELTFQKEIADLKVLVGSGLKRSLRERTRTRIPKPKASLSVA